MRGFDTARDVRPRVMCARARWLVDLTPFHGAELRLLRVELAPGVEARRRNACRCSCSLKREEEERTLSICLAKAWTMALFSRE